MQIAVLSDTHSRYATVEKALQLLQARKINVVLHCGDIEDAETLNQWLAVIITEGGGYCDAVFFAQGIVYFTSGDHVGLLRSPNAAPSRPRNCER